MPQGNTALASFLLLLLLLLSFCHIQRQEKGLKPHECTGYVRGPLVTVQRPSTGRCPLRTVENGSLSCNENEWGEEEKKKKEEKGSAAKK